MYYSYDIEKTLDGYLVYLHFFNKTDHQKFALTQKQFDHLTRVIGEINSLIDEEFTYNSD